MPYIIVSYDDYRKEQTFRIWKIFADDQLELAKEETFIYAKNYFITYNA